MLLLLACTAPKDDSSARESVPSPDSHDSGHESASESVPPADSPGDSPGDSHDSTGDTAPPASLESWGTEVGLPDGATWYALSVDGDGNVWGATSLGLVRFEPELARVTTWTTAQGLLADSVTAVLAASDGTIWVGHIADSTQQGERVMVEGDTLTVLQAIDYTESTEITSVVRLGEQPWGKGLGDVWMGTNEGLCLWDADVHVYAEHAHPTHPHGYSEGVTFTPEGDIWNGDQYQLSRWRYSNDGDLSPSADLFETIPLWPVELKEAISILDLDADGVDVWVASGGFGVARVTPGTEAATSVVELFAEPTSATAIRADGDGNVWIGTPAGLWRWDGTGMSPWNISGYIHALAVDPGRGPALWIAVDGGLTRMVGIPE